MCAVKFGIVGASHNDFITHEVEEKSYSPDAKILSGFSTGTFDGSKSFKHMAFVCGVNNRASIDFTEGEFKRRGEPTEAALKVFSEKLGKYDSSNPSVNSQKFPVSYSQNLMAGIDTVATLEFSSERKCMSTVVSGYQGQKGNTVLLKGAPERVLDKSSKIFKSNGEQVELSEDQRKEMKEHINKVASEGYRVLGIAIALDGGNMNDVTKENCHDKLADANTYAEFEGGCSFLGYVCIKDPCRPEVKPMIQECKTAGITVIMITGDARETAISIARELDILTPGQDTEKSCFTGAQFEELNKDQKIAILKGTHGKVFSRVEPRHKRELVKILIDQGEIVAMTGDGVNDAPAIKQASIGIAMGIAGTEVAK
jgi:Ca2+-transporting ATPase